MALPLALSGQDLIGQARTGTGKTYAFGIAMLQSIGKPRKNRKKPRGLVVVPTRELATQVSEDLVTAAGKLGSRVLTVYGGRAYEPQVQALKAGVDVIVGTPGRLLDLVKQKHLDLSQITSLVLDEADRMLDLGFLPDIERIFKLIPAERQTMLFSATMPGEIVSLSRRYLNRPTHIRAEHDSGEGETVPLTRQIVWRAHRMDKIEIVSRLLQADGRGLTMIFCETKRACDMVSEQLETRGFAVATVHGDLGQGQREQALRAFRNGKIDVLVATDVAARGIDVDDVTHVVNYDCPADDKAYVHRIGRTGRAGRTGIAVTFVEWEELTRWKMINQMLGLDFPDPVETYSTSPHVFTELNIPEGTKGVLPHASRSRAGLSAERIEDLGETGRPRVRAGRRRDEREEREERERPARTQSRQRRRTRGGRSAEEGNVVERPEVELVNGRSGTPEETPAIIGTDEVEAVATEPRRRTRARTAKAAPVAEPIAETAPVMEQAPVAAPETAPAPVPAPETATVAESAAVPVVEPVARPTQEPKPARRVRKRVTEPEAVPPAAPAAVTQPVTAQPVTEVVTEVVTEPAPEPVRAPVTTQAPSFLSTPPPPARQEPERIIPASPFSVIFQSPDLATDDDDIAPSAATERKQQRRQPPRGGNGNRRRTG